MADETETTDSGRSGRLIAVTMAPAAAEKLAQACGLAAGWASELWDGNDIAATAERRRRAFLAYEWLGWGQRWLVHAPARVELPPPDQTGDDHHRTPGDDVVVQLRVRRANLPALEAGVRLGIDALTGSAIEQRLVRRPDGIYDLEVVTNGAAMAAAPEAVDAEQVL